MNSWLEKLYDTFIVDDNYKMLIEGFGNTILITLCALMIGIVIGGIIAIVKYYAEGNKKLKIANWICVMYTTVIRGIPVTVLLMIFYFIRKKSKKRTYPSLVYPFSNFFESLRATSP